MVELKYFPNLDIPVLLERFWQEVWYAAYPKKGTLLDREESFSVLRKKYKDPRRSYHNWLHPQKMIRMLGIMMLELKETYGELLKESEKQVMEVPPELIWAIGYHDAEYNIESHRNEEQSAELMAMHLSVANTDLAEQLVLVTKTHKPTGMSLYECLMCDLDLHFLGVSPEEYDENTRCIADEYCTIYPVEVWEMGRKNFCKTFLERDRIFYTSPFYDKFEKQARENLERASQ
jgi:predicted metal-dependent HD superfamily phosphohydrolase